MTVPQLLQPKFLLQISYVDQTSDVVGYHDYGRARDAFERAYAYSLKDAAVLDVELRDAKGRLIADGNYSQPVLALPQPGQYKWMEHLGKDVRVGSLITFSP